MNRKKKIVLAIIIGILLFLLIAVICIKQRARKENRENALKIQSINAEGVLRDVAARGEVIIQEDRVVITDLELNERELLLRISYYNAETESELTLEQAKQQFEIYTENCEFLDGYTEELEDFCAFAEEEGLYSKDIGSPYGEYDRKVATILEEMGVDISSPTLEQLEEACQKALED